VPLLSCGRRRRAGSWPGWVALGAAMAALGGVACEAVDGAQSGAAAARFVRQYDWAGTGQWIAADLHTHSRFSDGNATVAELVDQAASHGCGALAVTDHADRQLKGATPEYELAIETARAAHPDLILISGLEWNVPPSGGDEHASVLLPNDRAEGALLAEFKRRFDDYDRGDDVVPSAEEALRWLREAGRGLAAMPVVTANHPSRKDRASLDNVDQMLAWRAAGDLVVSFEGAPGHQGDDPIGSYDGEVKTVDRWDPVTSPGDAWDVLLQRGVDVHAALANSDFHNANPSDLNDRWPCDFSETWLEVPDRTSAGVLRALRAGTFFGAHGHIAREVVLTVNADGLPRPAHAGEAISVPVGTRVTATLSAIVPQTDWAGQPNHLDRIEFVLVTPDRVTVEPHAVSGLGAITASQQMVVGPAGLVVRARGRREVPDGPDLLFYTNAIRLTAH
jgi:PHP domain